MLFPQASHASRALPKGLGLVVCQHAGGQRSYIWSLLKLQRKRGLALPKLWPVSLLLGCVLDATTIILVIIPLFLPTCERLGIDLVHFGVVAVVNCMIGLITPPYGILLFVINAVTRIPLAEIIREIWGFLAVLVVALGLIIVFPEITLFLPRLFGYQG